MSIASEAKQRKMAKTIVGDNIAADRGAFNLPYIGGGRKVRKHPLCTVPI